MDRFERITGITIGSVMVACLGFILCLLFYDGLRQAEGLLYLFSVWLSPSLPFYYYSANGDLLMELMILPDGSWYHHGGWEAQGRSMRYYVRLGTSYRIIHPNYQRLLKE